MKYNKMILTIICLLAMSFVASAGNRFSVGFTSPPKGTVAYQTITEALKNSASGDTVFVSAGIYKESELHIKAGVILIGGYAKDGNLTRRYPKQFLPFNSSKLDTTTQISILDGNSLIKTLPGDKHRVATVDRSGVIDGFLIRNGHVRNGNGGGVFVDGGTVQNSIIRGNVALSHPDSTKSLGGGVFLKNDGNLINSNVEFNLANADYGISVAPGSLGNLTGNTITGNTYAPVFAKIPGGKIDLYLGNTKYGSAGADYRDPEWKDGKVAVSIAKNVTVSDFDLSRTLRTEGQYAAFTAATDLEDSISGTSHFGLYDMDLLASLKDPISQGRKNVGGANHATDSPDSRYGNISDSGDAAVIGKAALLQHYQEDPGYPYPMLKEPESWAGLHYDNGVWHPRTENSAHAEYPVGYVSWYGALAFSLWLGGGLPSDAQWEFAARRNPEGVSPEVSDNLYSGAYGTTDPKDTVTWLILEQIAWFGVKIDPYTKKIAGHNTRPHEVARKQPNASGIYDMTGLSDEWIADRLFSADTEIRDYSPEFAGKTDPLYTQTTSLSRSRRGGAWDCPRTCMAIHVRWGNIPSTIRFASGFRPILAF
jgi:formylglycine-generating enzyme required for sulfatase activity